MGILQFYIHDDPWYGYRPKQVGVQEYYRVLYFPEVIECKEHLHTDFSFLPTYGSELPADPFHSFGLKFKLQQELLSPVDYNFNRIFGNDFFTSMGKHANEIWDTLFDLSDHSGHKIGGYAHFTQEDPRLAEDPMELLLQLDSDHRIQLLWGDMGIGHFFIRKRDLLKRDFSKVAFFWDNT